MRRVMYPWLGRSAGCPGERTGGLPPGHPGRYLVLLHAHVNLFGWVGLTVLGTLVMLVPAALWTRMSPAAQRATQRTLVACAVGLTVAAAWQAAGSGVPPDQNSQVHTAVPARA
ncbi:MAG: hypothetical protein ACYDB7_01695 [Mycobacteriales bacterium]